MRIFKEIHIFECKCIDITCDRIIGHGHVSCLPLHKSTPPTQYTEYITVIVKYIADWNTIQDNNIPIHHSHTIWGPTMCTIEPKTRH